MGFDLDIALKWAQIAAYVTVPIIVAVLGHLVSRASPPRTSPGTTSASASASSGSGAAPRTPNLHDWAVQMLQTYSPIPFSVAAKQELLEQPPGRPLGRLGQAGERGGGLLVTPDGTKVVAREDDGSIRVWDLATGKEVARLEG